MKDDYGLSSYLCHYGVPGMHPRVHKFGKFQRQAVYARGMSEEEIQKYTSEKHDNVKSMDYDDLTKDLQRLQKENDYVRALKQRGELEREYNNFLAQPQKAQEKQFWDKVGNVKRALFPLVRAATIMGGNYVKFQWYKAVESELGHDYAEAIVNGNIGDKKKKK